MWLVLALLTLLAVSFVIYPLIRTAPKPFAEEVYGVSGLAERANVVLFKEQLAELDRQLADGEIDDVQYAELVSEQKRLLLVDAPDLGDAQTGDSQASSTEDALNPEALKLKALKLQKSKGRGAWLLMTCLLLVPLLAFGLYQVLGFNEDVEIAELLEQRATKLMSSEGYAETSQQLQRKISRRLSRDPEHVLYWVTLARLQMDDNNFKGATTSYEQAVKWAPDDAELMAEYAQALYFVEGNKFSGAAGVTLDKALALNSSNRTALGLQGIRAFEAKDYRLAIASWQSALITINSGSQQAQALQSGIIRARKMLGEELPSLTVSVSLSPELKAAPGQQVYVFARQWQDKTQGAPQVQMMPLAVAKLSVDDLPVTVVLDDSMVMPGGDFLSSATAVQVVARVSITGSAIPSEGDFEGATGELSMSEHKQKLDVVIDRQL